MFPSTPSLDLAAGKEVNLARCALTGGDGVGSQVRADTEISELMPVEGSGDGHIEAVYRDDEALNEAVAAGSGIHHCAVN